MKSAKMAIVLIILVAAATMVERARAQVSVFVPGNASGYFGNWNDSAVPFVSALTVPGPGTITVTYVSGTVNWGVPGVDVGPNGGPYTNTGGFQLPLEEATGKAPHAKIGNIAALIGVFVPECRVNAPGFTAIDGTKNATKVGILPTGLFFIGQSKTLHVTVAGTLFLGINDSLVNDNSGGFNVTVSFQ